MQINNFGDDAFLSLFPFVSLSSFRQQGASFQCEWVHRCVFTFAHECYKGVGYATLTKWAMKLTSGMTWEGGGHDSSVGRAHDSWLRAPFPDWLGWCQYYVTGSERRFVSVWQYVSLSSVSLGTYSLWDSLIAEEDQGWATSGFNRNLGVFFFSRKKNLNPASWLQYFYRGKNRCYDRRLWLFYIIYKKRKGFEDRLLPQDLRVQYAHSSKRGPKLENTNLLHSSPPVEFFKLFITKMAEQTNFNVVQRGAIRSFKPASDVVINVYLCINIHTDTGRRPETIFWMFPM